MHSLKIYPYTKSKKLFKHARRHYWKNMQQYDPKINTFHHFQI